ncbi:hypothetical protein L9F63_007738, partial [Diploptera punctata]
DTMSRKITVHLHKVFPSICIHVPGQLSIKDKMITNKYCMQTILPYNKCVSKNTGNKLTLHLEDENSVEEEEFNNDLSKGKE